MIDQPPSGVVPGLGVFRTGIAETQNGTQSLLLGLALFLGLGLPDEFGFGDFGRGHREPRRSRCAAARRCRPAESFRISALGTVTSRTNTP
jgi:hypothetical protein